MQYQVNKYLVLNVNIALERRYVLPQCLNVLQSLHVQFSSSKDLDEMHLIIRTTTLQQYPNLDVLIAGRILATTHNHK